MNQKASGASGSHGQNAIELLIEDHNKVKQLFETFEMLEEDKDTEERKLDLVQEICTELTIHAQIEEEIFYPAAIEAIGRLDIMDEAAVEHAAAKDVIEQLMPMAPEEELYDAKVTVLKEMVEHHIQEEEGEMFPKLRKASMDLAGLGERMRQRKQELQRNIGMPVSAARKEQQSRKQAPSRPMH